MTLKVLASVYHDNGSVSVKTINFELDPFNEEHTKMYDLYKETGDPYYIHKVLPDDIFGDNDYSIVSIQEDYKKKN
ncbi:MAG: hypothetical protein N3A54_00590 [Patescibacteria group bacterium]|nr:hypothetical protein [Patescibacteria group bacterium]